MMLFLRSHLHVTNHASINRVQLPVSKYRKAISRENIINVSKAEIFIIFQINTLMFYCHVYTSFKHLVQSNYIVADSQPICISAL